jgi:hypothetical protein
MQTNGGIYLWVYQPQDDKPKNIVTESFYSYPDHAPRVYAIPYAKGDAKKLGDLKKSLADGDVIILKPRGKGAEVDGGDQGKEGKGQGKGSGIGGDGSYSDGTKDIIIEKRKTSDILQK